MTRKARKKPSPPPQTHIQGDHGPQTAMQAAGAILEPVEGDKNGTHFKRRVDWLEIYMRGQANKNGKPRVQPFLSMRQWQAGVEIRNSLEATQKRPAQTGERVDSSPKPDATIDVQCDATSRYVRARKGIPRGHAYVVDLVCEQNRPISDAGPEAYHKAMLQVALDSVANHLGY